MLDDHPKLNPEAKSYQVVHVDLLNGIILDGTLKIKTSSKPRTIEDHIKVQCHKVNYSKLKELQKNMTRISIKVSDVVLAAQLEIELKQMAEKEFPKSP